MCFHTTGRWHLFLCNLKAGHRIYGQGVSNGTQDQEVAGSNPCSDKNRLPHFHLSLWVVARTVPTPSDEAKTEFL